MTNPMNVIRVICPNCSSEHFDYLDMHDDGEDGEASCAKCGQFRLVSALRFELAAPHQPKETETAEVICIQCKKSTCECRSLADMADELEENGQIDSFDANLLRMSRIIPGLFD